MHIPDGYLSPSSCLALFGASVPAWAWSVRRVERQRAAALVPAMALGGALSFTLMLFNVPFLGTSGHAVGSGLLAILLGPEAACLAVTVALAIQAFIFGDGGILSLGANCLNMAIIEPWVTAAVYRGLSLGRSDRGWLTGAAAIAGYLGIGAAATAAAVELGLQPILARAADGHALYCPYGLRTTLPAIVGLHLVAFGLVEAMVTAMVVAAVLRSPLPIFDSLALTAARDRARLRPITWYRQPGLAVGTVVVLALVVASPLGLLTDAKAWGEWDVHKVSQGAGYTPPGMARWANRYTAPLPDYGQAGAARPAARAVAYVQSALIGVLAIAVALAGVGLLVRRARRAPRRTGSEDRDAERSRSEP